MLVTDTVTPANADTEHAAILAAGLRAIADMIERHPEVAQNLRYAFGDINVPCYERTEIAALTRAALDVGAKVDKKQNDKWAGALLKFAERPGALYGGVGLNVYTEREKLCERVVVGTREVTEEVPDPEALAAVPKVSVTTTVEDVEWRCRPLLASDEDGAR